MSRRKWDDRGSQQPPVIDHKKLAQDIAGRINLQLQQQQQVLQKQRPVRTINNYNILISKGLGYGSGPFTREIEINNSKSRYTLTKGSTHDMVFDVFDYLL